MIKRILLIALLLPTLCFAQTLTNAEWDKLCIEEGLHVKFNKQLSAMLISHQAKLAGVADICYYTTKYPDVIRSGCEREGYSALEIEKEVARELVQCASKVTRLEEIVERIEKEQDLRARGVVVRKPIGTTYYINLDCGTTGDGTTTDCDGGADDVFNNLDAFVEAARSAGDKGIVKRGTSQASASALSPVSVGAEANPIILEADYDDNFSTDVDLSGTETATLTFGSKTVTFSGDISGVLSAGDWIYEGNDDQREFAYEVSGISGGSSEIATLYLPYKGANAGAGKTMINMGAAPTWGAAAGAYSVEITAADAYWLIQGISFASTFGTGVIALGYMNFYEFKDCIFIGNGAADYMVFNKTYNISAIWRKCRFFDYAVGFYYTETYGPAPDHYLYDCLLDGNSVADAIGIKPRNSDIYRLYDCEFAGNDEDIEFDWTWVSRFNVTQIYTRNCVFSASDTEFKDIHQEITSYVYNEDYDGTPNDSRIFGGPCVDSATPLIVSETTKVRSGGGATSIKVTPSTRLSTVWDYSRIKLFEYPIYADTTSKTYTVYFYPDDNTDWTATPTATELWIEAEYWNHATNDHRIITKSLGTVDMTSDAWQSLTVTVQPAQTGILYLRGWYVKPQEGGKSNLFYVDIKPSIS